VTLLAANWSSWDSQDARPTHVYCVMDDAVGCCACGGMFSCMAFRLCLGSSEDIPAEQVGEMALFSQFGDAPVPEPGGGHVVSGRWRRARGRAPGRAAARPRRSAPRDRPRDWTGWSLVWCRCLCCVLAVHCVVACLHSFGHLIAGWVRRTGTPKFLLTLR